MKSKLHYTKKKLTHITLQSLSFSFCVSYSKKKKANKKIMALEQQIFEKKQKSDYTDCSFVFKTETVDGEQSEKLITAHKVILSAASQFFETNFKSEWKGNDPIPVTTVPYFLFDKLIRAIYLSEIDLENLDEALELYKAAHFYQIELILDLLRDQIPKFCYSNKIMQISELYKTTWKYQDAKLMQFITKYFAHNANKIIEDEDFFNFTPDSINLLYQLDELSVDECKLYEKLEEYIFIKETTLISTLKPAIGAIRFLALRKEVIQGSSLLSKTEKDFLLGKKVVNILYLSKSKKGRKQKPFYSLLRPRTQIQLREKFSIEMCWLCNARHNMFACHKIQEKYDMYCKIYHKGIILGKYQHTTLALYSKTHIIQILKEFQRFSAIDSKFSSFAHIDEELDNIFYV